MTDFFEWLTASDYGLAAERLAEAYNLSQKELRETAQALAPAFAMALARTMTDGDKSNDLAQQFARFFGTSGDATRQSAARKPAADLTESLFGSRALTDAIARQVSSVTGTAPDVVGLLMRNFTLMTLQTTMQMAAANIARQQPKGLAEGDYPTAFAEMMRRGANAVEALGRPSDEVRPRSGATPGFPEPMAAMMRAPFAWADAFAPPQGSAGDKRPNPAFREAERRKDDGSATPGQVPTLPFFAMLEGFAAGLSATKPEAGASETPQPASLTRSAGKDAGLPADKTPRTIASEGDEETARNGEPKGDARAGEPGDDRPATPTPAGASPAAIDNLFQMGAEFQDDYLKRMAALFETHPPHEGAKPRTGTK